MYLKRITVCWKTRSYYFYCLFQNRRKNICILTIYILEF